MDGIDFGEDDDSMRKIFDDASLDLIGLGRQRLQNVSFLLDGRKRGGGDCGDKIRVVIIKFDCENGEIYQRWRDSCADWLVCILWGEYLR